MKTVLFQQDFNLSHAAHQSHLVYRVYIPKDLQSIELQFQYGPIVEKNTEAIARSVLKEGLAESVIQDDTALRNLLTVSINDPLAFRGAHHFFAENQSLTIGPDKATDGFIAGELSEGYWEFIISCHGVFSNEVQGHIKVQGISSNYIKKDIMLPLENIALVQQSKKRTPIKNRAYQVKRIELHTHTIHSDAPQTTEELLAQADREQIDWLAITDHNTVSALMEAKQQGNYDKQVSLLQGIEYTTFHGHFLVHGAIEDITADWTKVSKANLHRFLEKLKENETYITIAHPFDAGNPFCTGCRWDFTLANLKNIDAIEVWNGTNPHQSSSNESAFYKWTELLGQGYEIAASCGRDWHQLYPGEEIAYTYVEIPDNGKEVDVRNALLLGRSYISIRPEIELIVNDAYHIGDRIEEALEEWNVMLGISNLQGGDEIQLFSESGMVFNEMITSEQNWAKEIFLKDDQYKLLRVEILNKEKERIAFTNPIYRSVPII